MSRRIPDPLIIQTIFGPEVATQSCNCCGEVKYIHEFYCETPSKLKKFKRYGEQVRHQCIECWAYFQGRTFLNKKKRSSNGLDRLWSA